MLLVAGPDAFVTEPADLRNAGRDLARELLAHHRNDATPEASSEEVEAHDRETDPQSDPLLARIGQLSRMTHGSLTATQSPV